MQTIQQLKDTLDNITRLEKQLKEQVIYPINSVCLVNATIKNTNKVFVKLGDYYVQRSSHQAKQIAHRMIDKYQNTVDSKLKEDKLKQQKQQDENDIRYIYEPFENEEQDDKVFQQKTVQQNKSQDEKKRFLDSVFAEMKELESEDKQQVSQQIKTQKEEKKQEQQKQKDEQDQEQQDQKPKKVSKFKKERMQIRQNQ